MFRHEVHHFIRVIFGYINNQVWKIYPMFKVSMNFIAEDVLAMLEKKYSSFILVFFIVY